MIPIKDSENVFFVVVRINKLSLKFLKKCKEPKIPKEILQKKKIGRLKMSDFDNYNKATIIKRVYIATRKDRLMQ